MIFEPVESLQRNYQCAGIEYQLFYHNDVIGNEHFAEENALDIEQRTYYQINSQQQVGQIKQSGVVYIIVSHLYKQQYEYDER